MIRLLVFSAAPKLSDYPPPNPPIKAVNKSVRNHPMRGTRVGDVVTIIMKNAMSKTQRKYPIDVVEFVGKTKWEQLQTLGRMFAHWDDEPGGPEQATRLREGFVDIIRQLTPKASTPTGANPST